MISFWLEWVWVHSMLNRVWHIQCASLCGNENGKKNGCRQTYCVNFFFLSHSSQLPFQANVCTFYLFSSMMWSIFTRRLSVFERAHVYVTQLVYTDLDFGLFNSLTNKRPRSINKRNSRERFAGRLRSEFFPNLSHLGYCLVQRSERTIKMRIHTRN